MTSKKPCISNPWPTLKPNFEEPKYKKLKIENQFRDANFQARVDNEGRESGPVVAVVVNYIGDPRSAVQKRSRVRGWRPVSGWAQDAQEGTGGVVNTGPQLLLQKNHQPLPGVSMLGMGLRNSRRSRFVSRVLLLLLLCHSSIPHGNIVLIAAVRGIRIGGSISSIWLP